MDTTSGRIGELRTGHHRLPLRWFRLSRSILDAAVPWTFEAEADTENEDWITVVASSTFRTPPAFHGVTDAGTHLRARLFTSRKEAGQRVAGTLIELDEFELGPEGQTISQAVEVLLSPSFPVPLPRNASSEQWAWSRQSVWRQRSRFRFTLGGRRYRLSATTRERPSTIAGVAARTEVALAALQARLLAPPFVTEAKPFFDGFRTEVDETTSLLSFLERVPVVWTEMSLHTRTLLPSGERTVHSAWRYRRLLSPPPHRDAWGALVAPSQIDTGGLDAMLLALRTNPDSAALQRTIYHLNESRQTLAPHHALLHAFTALETLAGTLPSTADPLDEGLHRELERRLRREIKVFATEHTLEPTTRRQLYAKLSELRRPPLIPRLVAAIDSTGLSLDFLWTHDHRARRQSLTERLRDAYARRSRLVHAGYVESAFEAHGDLVRVRAVTEMLLFRQLEGRTEWLPQWTPQIRPLIDTAKPATTPAS